MEPEHAAPRSAGNSQPCPVINRPNTKVLAVLLLVLVVAVVVAVQKTKESTLPLETLPDYILEALEDPTTPQSRALSWMEKHPDRNSIADWRKLQLFALASAFYTMQLALLVIRMMLQLSKRYKRLI